MTFLADKPKLANIVELLDSYLVRAHPGFFGSPPEFRIRPVKRSKVIHDSLWGTNRFSWQELLLIDCPILQRLREIHQVGLAYHIYPTAHHTRFEHSLGVLTIASRIFEALLHRNKNKIVEILRSLDPKLKEEGIQTGLARLHQELRLAALLHDTGHCLYSHVSEKIYQDLTILKDASAELAEIVGKEKGCGEVISFCLALTPSVDRMLSDPGITFVGDALASDYNGPLNMTNVALLIVGRSSHPFLQFLGDIISSLFDADKLDYLIRDATEAGLPLRYDLDMYLASVRLEPEELADGDGVLQKTYSVLNTIPPTRKDSLHTRKWPYYEVYRLRLPKKAMHVIEQVILCKLMLFSYLYHHRKVRAAESLLERLLERSVRCWRDAGMSEADILQRLLKNTDAWISARPEAEWEDDISRVYSYRLVNRLLPCELYHLSASETTHTNAALLGDFLTKIQDRNEKERCLKDLHEAIGEELVKVKPTLGTTSSEALARAGIWIDVPKVPKFEDVESFTVRNSDQTCHAPLLGLFPIDKWQSAYMTYRYFVRIYCFPEYCEEAAQAAKQGMKRVIKIDNEEFYKTVLRIRE